MYNRSRTSPQLNFVESAHRENIHHLQGRCISQLGRFISTCGRGEPVAHFRRDSPPAVILVIPDRVTQSLHLLRKLANHHGGFRQKRRREEPYRFVCPDCCLGLQSGAIAYLQRAAGPTREEFSDLFPRQISVLFQFDEQAVLVGCKLQLRSTWSWGWIRHSWLTNEAL